MEASASNVCSKVTLDQLIKKRNLLMVFISQHRLGGLIARGLSHCEAVFASKKNWVRCSLYTEMYLTPKYMWTCDWKSPVVAGDHYFFGV
jgi:hypothetical protein